MGAIRTVALNMPATATAGTSLDVSGFEREGRTLIVTGDATGDNTDIEVSADNTNFVLLKRLIGPNSSPVNLSDVTAPFLRVNRRAVATAAPIMSFVGEETTTFQSEANSWQLAHAPAAAAQATATQAAGAAGLRNYCTGIQATVSTIAATAQTPINVHIRDGASGAGTIIWTGSLAALGTTTGILAITFPQPIRGTAATAMTVEFSGAGVANSLETIAAQGYVGP